MTKRRRPLTTRELDVLRLLCTGLSGREIGAALGISPCTVAVHRANIKKATGAHTTAQLVVHAIVHGHVRLSKLRSPSPAAPARGKRPDETEPLLTHEAIR